MEHDDYQTSLSADLNLIYKNIPSELLSEEGYQRLSAVTSMLPVALTNFWGLECRLHEQAPLTDILFEIKKTTAGQKLLAGQVTSSLDPLCIRYPVWREIRSFAAQWNKDQTLLNKHILNLWLEFDTERVYSHETALELIAQPSVFLGFRSTDLSTGELRDLLEQSSNFLQKTRNVLENIVSFIESIPPPGRLFQLGSMLGRPCRDTRVCINNLNPRVIPQWLSDIGWRGDTKALTVILDMLAPLVRTIAVDLNLTETGISEKIGIECYLDWEENNCELWAGFLDILNEYVLIHPSKRNGLLQYPGKLAVPAALRKHDKDILSLLLFKMIHHVKLGFQDGRISDAKAYLAIYRPGIQPNNNWLVE